MSEAHDNLFVDLLGERYAALPAPVRALHERALPATLYGEVAIEVARNAFVRVLARVAGLPREGGNFPLVFEILGTPARQTWVRHFPPRPMRSTLSIRDGLLHEQLGLVRLCFRLEGDAAGITWQPAAASFVGVPLPLRWFGGIEARESADGARYRFDVSARLPLLGHVVTYRGWLGVDPPRPA